MHSSHCRAPTRRRSPRLIAVTASPADATRRRAVSSVSHAPVRASLRAAVLFLGDGAFWHAEGMDEPDDLVLVELLERCRRDHRLWINGDAGGYELPARGTIFGGVGGQSFGGPETLNRQRSVARQWKSGQGGADYVSGFRNDDFACLVMIERATVAFVDENAPRRWDLRVTEIFQREGTEWQRVHRHADPLVDRHALADLFALLPQRN